MAGGQAVRQTGCEPVVGLSAETGGGRGKEGWKTPDLPQLFLTVCTPVV